MVACWLLFPASVLFGQKPKVAIVVWDGHCKEGQNVGTFRVYQLGEHLPGLKVKLKCEGIAEEGLDYRSPGLGIIQKVDKYNDLTVFWHISSSRSSSAISKPEAVVAKISRDNL